MERNTRERGIRGGGVTVAIGIIERGLKYLESTKAILLGNILAKYIEMLKDKWFWIGFVVVLVVVVLVDALTGKPLTAVASGLGCGLVVMLCGRIWGRSTKGGAE